MMNNTAVTRDAIDTTKMADVRVQVQEAYIRDLRQKLGVKTYPEVVQHALTLLNWAVDEKEHGRLILSTNKAGDDVARLAMPALSAVREIQRHTDGE